jgi:hypothetical protein
VTRGGLVGSARVSRSRADGGGAGSFDDIADVVIDRPGHPSGGVHVGTAVPGHRGPGQGKTLTIDATTLEANAALRSIVRRDTGESYQDFLTKLAQASGIETPTRADLAQLDRKRKKKGSNQDWEHPYDSDARIAKMKDGRTHLAHKAEHAVDLEAGGFSEARPYGRPFSTTYKLRILTGAPLSTIHVKHALDQMQPPHPRLLG